MVINNWDKIFELLPLDTSFGEPSSSIDISQAQSADSDTHSSAFPLYSQSGNQRLKIISEYVDLSKSAEKLFEDISLKKIKKMASDKVEKEVIIFVLEHAEWNRSKAAKILKVSYKTLLYKMNEFDVTPPVG